MLSSTKATASYGYYEARLEIASLPTSSSFWLQGRYSEIDITESFGEGRIGAPVPPQRMHAGTQYFPHGWKTAIGTGVLVDSAPLKGPHTYGVWWKGPTKVLFYLDGRQVYEGAAAGYFNEPMYLYFDTEEFSWEGLPAPSELTDPARNCMTVRWVRSYHLVRNDDAGH